MKMHVHLHHANAKHQSLCNHSLRIPTLAFPPFPVFVLPDELAVEVLRMVGLTGCPAIGFTLLLLESVDMIFFSTALSAIGSDLFSFSSSGLLVIGFVMIWTSSSVELDVVFASRIRPDALTPFPLISVNLGDLRRGCSCSPEMSKEVWSLMVAGVMFAEMFAEMLRSESVSLVSWSEEGSSSGSMGVGRTDRGRFPRALRRGLMDLAFGVVTGEGEREGLFSFEGSSSSSDDDSASWGSGFWVTAA